MASLTDADVLAARNARAGDRTVTPTGAEPEDAAGESSDVDAEIIEGLSSETGVEDPLLDCLVHLTAHYGSPKSPGVLKAGLPHSGEVMSATMFVRAAGRVGLSARVVRRRLNSINKLVLPTVLILKGARACSHRRRVGLPKR